jgi:carbon monoxide dehydrogenase subunit G
MKVAIEKAFPIAAPPGATWAVLGDVEAVASCMPGAKITERIDATHYKGTVTVKVGPATLSFRGEIEVAGLDPAARSLHLIAKGTDTTGSSAASMDLTASVEADGATASRLKGVCETSMSGKAAAFGGRLMNGVADQVLEQFAKNFAARVAASVTPAAGGDSSSPGTTPSSASGAPRPPEAAPELDGLALAWGAFRRWLRDLFAKKPA